MCHPRRCSQPPREIHLGFIKGDYTGIEDAPRSVEFEGGTLSVSAAGNVTRS